MIYDKQFEKEVRAIIADQDDNKRRIDESKVRVQSRRFMIYTDEDFKPILQFSPDNDQNYTMGFGFGYSGPNLNRAHFLRPLNWVERKIRKWSGLTDKDVVFDISPNLSLNGTAFTPDDLRATEVIKEDRPYAFLLSLSTKKFLLIEKSGKLPSLLTTEFALGVLGLNLGKAVQTAIHRGMNDGNTKDPYLPEGWHHQISNGGEFTLLGAITKEFLLTPKQFRDARNKHSYFELKGGVQGMVGWYTAANAQLSARVGLLDPKNWTQNFNLLGSGNKGADSGDKNLFELYLYGSIRPSMMFYNELLHGGFKKSDHTFSASQVNTFGIEWNTGLGFNLPGANYTTNLVWAFNSGRSKEFITSLARPHQWGSIYITFVY